MGAQAWGAEPLLAGATMEMASHRIEVLIHSCTYFLMKLHASHQAPPPPDDPFMHSHMPFQGAYAFFHASHPTRSVVMRHYNSVTWPQLRWQLTVHLPMAKPYWRRALM